MQMSLFKTKVKAAKESCETPNPPENKQRKKFALFKKGGSTPPHEQKDPAASPSNQTAKTLHSQTPSPPRRGDACAIDLDVPVDANLPDGIPRSFSAWAPNRVLSDLGIEEQRGDDEMVRVFSQDDVDSLGPPCEKFRKSMEDNKSPGSNAMNPPDGSREAPGVDIHNPPSVEHLSYYIAALSSPDPSRALRSLFTLSEHASSHSDRVAMAHWKPPKEDTSSSLIPALLDFLKRCQRDSSEQYLAMLVLNNISIPHENKRIIALDCGGAKTLARLLCQDPGCHLVVIILVNLTYCEVSVRRDLLTFAMVPECEKKSNKNGRCGGDAHLVDALAYALLLASLSNEELASLPPIPLAGPDGVPHTPRKLLSILTSNLESMNIYTSRYTTDLNAPPLTFEGGFAETARWSLCALKNLTRPDKLAKSSLTNSGAAGSDSVAAYAILDAGVIPLLLRIVRLEISVQDPLEVGGAGSTCWTLNSAQDAALYTLMHMASVPEVRGVLMDECGLPRELSKIVGQSNEKLTDLVIGTLDSRTETTNIAKLGLQSMKARIALANLLLSEGYYGQPKSKRPLLIHTNQVSGDSSVIISNHEAHYLVELLSNCLHSRPKDGYSASSFSLKGTLHAIRCLMSKRENRLVLASHSARINTLLLKTIALYSFRESNDGGINDIMDSEAAEHAVFSLYLMSNHGFQANFDLSNSENCVFLPAEFEGRGEKEQLDAKEVFIKVLGVYTDSWDVTPAGLHAALQLLFRVMYLRCSGSAADLVYPGKPHPCKSDFSFDQELLDAIGAASVEKRMEGFPPSADIFRRAIVRYHSNAVEPRTYPNALAAVEEISFGSSTTDHSGTIDEICIANNLVNAADGLTRQAYGFAWRWEEEDASATAHPFIDEPLLDDVSETERSAPYSPRRRGIFGWLRFNGGGDDDEPLSVFGFRCGPPMCGK